MLLLHYYEGWYQRLWGLAVIAMKRVRRRAYDVVDELGGDDY